MRSRSEIDSSKQPIFVYLFGQNVLSASLNKLKLNKNKNISLSMLSEM